MSKCTCRRWIVSSAFVCALRNALCCDGEISVKLFLANMSGTLISSEPSPVSRCTHAYITSYCNASEECA